MTRRGEPASGPAGAERLVLAPSLGVEQIEADAATLHLGSSGARLRVPRALYELLLRFERPTSLDALDARGQRARAALEKLRARGFLLRDGEPEPAVARRPTTDPPVRLFDCPAQKLEPARADLVVLGVPYDQAQPQAAGARQGPLAIRETSLQLLYAVDRRTGRPRGWFDADRGRAILGGTSIADAGDVFVDPGEPQAPVFGRVSQVLRTALTGGALPVLLGGDASIGFPAVECLQSRAPIAVIRIGAVDRSEPAPAPGFVTPASFAARALALPGVTCHVQIGGSPDQPSADEALVPLSIESLRRSGLARLTSRLAPGTPIYLGLDLDLVDTDGDTGRIGGRPARLDYDEAHALLGAIGAAYPIRGLDLVGLNPVRPGWNAASMTALHLLVTAMSAAKDRHVI